MTLLHEIDAAVRGLRAAGCYRSGGYWLTQDNVALAMDPLSAFELLKRETMRRAVDHEIRSNGGRMTREYIPSGTR
ncbi:MAG: hypothetical protein IPK63_23730 [Candidatus Competibacteraceae bacterium]|nr:hypothetical protein [Candidatus Competibacteraceae bacterium]